jgi:hypothetical protein
MQMQTAAPSLRFREYSEVQRRRCLCCSRHRPKAHNDRRCPRPRCIAVPLQCISTLATRETNTRARDAGDAGAEERRHNGAEQQSEAEGAGWWERSGGSRTGWHGPNLGRVPIPSSSPKFSRSSAPTHFTAVVVSLLASLRRSARNPPAHHFPLPSTSQRQNLSWDAPASMVGVHPAVRLSSQSSPVL